MDVRAVALAEPEGVAAVQLDAVHQSDVLRLLDLQHGKQVFECHVMWEGVED